MIEGQGLPRGQETRKKLEYPLLRVQPNQVVTLRLLDEVTGLFFHWHQERGDVPCLPGCQRCPDPKQRWKGYVPALWWRGLDLEWTAVTVELRETTAAPLATVTARGLLVRINRHEKNRHDPGELTILESKTDEPLGWQDRRGWDVMAVVFRVCGVSKEERECPADPEPTVIPMGRRA